MRTEPRPGLLPSDAPLAGEVCDPLPIHPAEMAQVFRYLGYQGGATPRAANRKRIEAIVTEALPLLQPRGVYRLYPVTSRTAHSMKIAGIAIRGSIGEFLDQARRVAVFVVTAGEEISVHAQSAAKDGDALAAWAIDAVGSWAAEAAADALMLRIRPHLESGEDLTLRYSPGYCGMDISQQRNLFELLPAHSAGVRLLPAMLMHPLKSVSGIVGLAPKEAIAQYRSPCDLCPKTGCHMRRTG